MSRSRPSRASDLARGFTLVELLVALTLASLVMLGLARVVRSSGAAEADRDARASLAADCQFALERMTAAVRDSPHLLLPLADDPRTGADEAVREQSIPARSGHASETAVLAVTLPRTLDRNADGTPDVDDDRDGRIDEDHGIDSTDDDATGIVGIDDDNDGAVDEIVIYDGDDDEDLVNGDDPLNGKDDDGDGNVDEDLPGDMNGDGQPGVAGVDDDGDGIADEGNFADDDEDGSIGEDGYDPVVFHLTGSTLFERVPVPWDANKDGLVNAGDFVDQAIASGVTWFRVERIEGDRAQLVDITLALAAANGARVQLSTRQRLGAGT
jgi:prepilin-type N-terminal cleavage/methylation domain-containing protein